MLINIAIASLMMLFITVLYVAGLSDVMFWIKAHAPTWRQWQALARVRKIGGVALLMFCLSIVEAFARAAACLLVRVFNKVVFAPYFSAVTLLVFSVAPGWAGGDFDGVLNAVYMIEKQAVRLVNGMAESTAAPGSAAKITTRAVGQPVFGDLDGDQQEDAVLFIVRESGGSGTFYYVAAAVVKNSHWQGTNAVFLGDRIVPHRIHIRNGIIIVSYAGRRMNQSFAAPATTEKTMCLTLSDRSLEVPASSEGCAKDMVPGK